MTTNTQPVQLDSSLYGVAQRALDAAIQASVGAEPLVPFTMVWRQDEISVERYMYGAYDDSIEQAMRAVNQMGEDVSAYAVAWSGYVELEGRRKDALIVEVGGRHGQKAAQLAQTYRVSGETDSITPDPELLSVGETHNLLHHKFTSQSMGEHLLKPAYVSTDSYATDLKAQPFAQLPVALVCLAANLFQGQERARVTVGIREFQRIESAATVDLSRRVFGVVTAAVANGDLMQVLPTDNVVSLSHLVLEGVSQIQSAVKRSLLLESDARCYLHDVQGVLQAVLTNAGTEPLSAPGQKLWKLLEYAATNAELA